MMPVESVLHCGAVFGNKPRVTEKKLSSEIEKAHQEAESRGEPMYRDPKTGYSVMTESFLKQRGYCCRSGCRHCPYGFAAQATVSH